MCCNTLCYPFPSVHTRSGSFNTARWYTTQARWFVVSYSDVTSTGQHPTERDQIRRNEEESRKVCRRASARASVDYGSRCRRRRRRRCNHVHPLSQFATRACRIHANETFALNGEWLLQIYDAARARSRYRNISRACFACRLPRCFVFQRAATPSERSS